MNAVLKADISEAYQWVDDEEAFKTYLWENKFYFKFEGDYATIWKCEDPDYELIMKRSWYLVFSDVSFEVLDPDVFDRRFTIIDN